MYSLCYINFNIGVIKAKVSNGAIRSYKRHNNPWKLLILPQCLLFNDVYVRALKNNYILFAVESLLPCGQ